MSKKNLSNNIQFAPSYKNMLMSHDKCNWSRMETGYCMINDILCYHYYTWCQDKCPYQGVLKGILKREGNTFF